MSIKVFGVPVTNCGRGFNPLVIPCADDRYMQQGSTILSIDPNLKSCIYM